MTLRELYFLIRWDFRINHGWSFDRIRARLILLDIRLEQFVYRNFYRAANPISILWFFTRFFGSIHQWFLANSNIPGTTTIGRGLRLPHPQNIIVAGWSNIGEFCTIYQNVTIAWNGFIPVKNDSPKIGDRVLIGTGVIILGDVTIGSDALIGAGTVIVKSIPDHSRVVGPSPAISTRHPSENAAIPGSDHHIQDPYSIWQ